MGYKLNTHIFIIYNLIVVFMAYLSEALLDSAESLLCSSNITSIFFSFNALYTAT